jgi:glutamine synthetase type III
MGPEERRHPLLPLVPAVDGSHAEKHDSFITPTRSGKVLLEFSGKELIRGESDASSFPNGGLRTTFEARGYTAWDTSSPAFIKETGGQRILYIPTAFFSYNGEALDKKVPLLRSTAALEKQTLRVLRLLGKPAKRITVNIGPEQEYFLVNKDSYDQRPDLRLTGRTVLAHSPRKARNWTTIITGRSTTKWAISWRNWTTSFGNLAFPARHSTWKPLPTSLRSPWCTTPPTSQPITTKC